MTEANRDAEGRCKMRGCNLCDSYRKKLEADKWIPCEERLPKNEGRYLTCDKKGNIHVFYHHASLEYPFEIGENHLQYYPPVAWQPLPQPYKKEGAE